MVGLRALLTSTTTTSSLSALVPVLAGVLFGFLLLLVPEALAALDAPPRRQHWTLHLVAQTHSRWWTRSLAPS
jgi:hypothetical protein